MIGGLNVMWTRCQLEGSAEGLVDLSPDFVVHPHFM